MREAAARWGVACTVGGVACVVGDHLHVAEGVLFYPNRALWDQAWWVFPLFFGATVAVLSSIRFVHPEPDPLASLENLNRAAAADFLGFLTAYAFTAFGSSMPNVVLWTLVALFVLRVVRGMAPRHVLFCLGVAVAGTSWEAMWSGIGMFTYHHPDFLGVPRWLPALYLHAAVAADSARRVVVGNREGNLANRT